jgi:hypothetical protein
VGARQILRRVERGGVSETTDNEHDGDLKRNTAEVARMPR